MTHALQFLDYSVNATVADKQDGIGKPADDVLGELLAS